MKYHDLLQIREEGHYACKVKQAKTELKLRVKQLPNKIRRGLKDVTGTEEQPSVVFFCVLEK